MEVRTAIRLLMALFIKNVERSPHFHDEEYWDIPLKSRNKIVRNLVKGEPQRR